MTKALPPFLRELIESPPKAGEGIHNWMFRVARQLHAHLPATEIVSVLESRAANCGRHVGRAEIVSAVQSSLACAWTPANSAARAKPLGKWPAVNKEHREAIVRDGGALADLWEISPWRLEDTAKQTEFIIENLFPGNPLLCCGKSSQEFDTRPRDAWGGALSGLQFIVPSPMTAVEGVTKAGKPSRHTLSNTGPRRFLIVEFDSGTTDEHAALVLHLGGYAPLVCAVHSGNKSLHGWFLVAGQPEDKMLKFFRYAVSIGADPATWTRSQFVRMPDGTRDNGKRQTVFFLSVKPLEGTR
jgi:hypothetical protein